MNLKITFHNMPHSDPLEAHAHEKFSKLAELLAHIHEDSPVSAELWLKANKQHDHHAVELHIRSAEFDLNAHDQGADMYVALDNTMDKMLKQVKKEKERLRDRMHKPDTEKRKFER